jgi:hypothetical protein
MSGRGRQIVGLTSSQTCHSSPSPMSSPTKPGHQYSVSAVSTAHGGGASSVSVNSTVIATAAIIIIRAPHT